MNTSDSKKKQVVSSSSVVSQPTQQSAKAMYGPHGQQRSSATKAVYVTCVPMCFADNTPTIGATPSDGGSDGNIFAVVEQEKKNYVNIYVKNY